jgi:hypothetical protein
MQLMLSCGDKKEPAGQLSTQLPCERTKPAKQPVHCSWLMVEATLNPGIPQEVHFEGQA